jgi:hypothetical protein
MEAPPSSPTFIRPIKYTHDLGVVPRRWEFTLNDKPDPKTGTHPGKFVKVPIKAQVRHWWSMNNPLRRRAVVLQLEAEDYFHLLRSHDPIPYTDSEDEEDEQVKEKVRSPPKRRKQEARGEVDKEEIRVSDE